MSIPRGGAQPPVPQNTHIQGAPQPQAPQPPAAAANAPVLHVPAAAVSPLQAPSTTAPTEHGSLPQLSPRQAFATQLDVLQADWVNVEEKLRCGDSRSVHRMLDQGLMPCVVYRYETDQLVFISFPDRLFRNVQDVELFDRFVDLFAQYGLQGNLYRLVMEAGNGILLKRLVQGGVPGWQGVADALPDLMGQALLRGDPVQLDAFLRLWKEHCPTVALNWAMLWRKHVGDKCTCPEAAVLSILIRHIRSDRLGADLLAQMFEDASRAGKVEAVACLCQGLGPALDTFVESRDWKNVQDQLSVDCLLVLSHGGFPLSAKVLPPPDHPKAQELQSLLFGPKLAGGPFATIVQSAEQSPFILMEFLYRCAVGKKRNLAGSGMPVWMRRVEKRTIERSLFENGLALAISSKLAGALAIYAEKIANTRIIQNRLLEFFACLNECLGPDAVDPLDDPLSIEQAQAIHHAMVESLKQTLGEPTAFFAWAIACVNKDGTVDKDKLALVYGHEMGLPREVVDQMGVTLTALCAEAMASPFPPALFKPGITGEQLQSSLHDWVRQGVARRIAIRLPADLGATIARRDREGVDSDDLESDPLSDQNLLAQATNYLVTSLIRQYGNIIAEHLDAGSSAVVEACAALPPDWQHALGTPRASDEGSGTSVEEDSSDESAPETDDEQDSDSQ